MNGGGLVLLSSNASIPLMLVVTLHFMVHVQWSCACACSQKWTILFAITVIGFGAALADTPAYADLLKQAQAQKKSYITNLIKDLITQKAMSQWGWSQWSVQCLGSLHYPRQLGELCKFYSYYTRHPIWSGVFWELYLMVFLPTSLTSPLQFWFVNIANQ